MKEGLVLTSGRLFTVQERYRSALRISYAHPWADQRISALQTLGALLQGEEL